MAFNLGKTAYTITRRARTAVSTAKKTVSSARVTFKRGPGRTRAKKGRVKILPGVSEALDSPIQKEIKSLCDISGLTAAIREMNEISLLHSSHPAILRLFEKIKALSPAEQEILSRRFIERLTASPYFNKAILSIPTTAKMTEEDARRMSDAFIKCLLQTLGDMGVAPEDQELLQRLSDEVMRPFNDLMEFYLKPKTFSQKMKRLWRIQRMLAKAAKLIHLTKGLATAAENPATGTIQIPDLVPHR